MAATGDAAVARSQGAATARTLRAAGVNVDLAPVVDVARRGSQMEGEKRAFGSDAASVTRYATAFVRGLAGGGVIATAKHFPGFGAASANTDDARVRIRLSLGELRRVDRVPFVQAVRAGARMVMTSSAIYPALDTRPALLARRVVTGELRGAAGFGGVTITDALDTAALAPYRDVAVRAADAGNDLLSYSTTYAAAERAAAALAAALRSGRLAGKPARASLARTLALRRTAVQ